MTPKLSILILTIPDRADKLERLMNVLRPQLPTDNSVEVIVKEELPFAQGGPTIGANRNAAVADAIGDYVCFIGDDDLVPEYYVERILEAPEKHLIKSAMNVMVGPEGSLVKAIRQGGPDVIGLKGHYIVGKNEPQLFIHSMQFKEWKTVGQVHQRCPNHLNPVKRDLAVQVGYPEWNHGEDHEYSMKLLPLLRSEVMVDGIMYFYMR